MQQRYRGVVGASSALVACCLFVIALVLTGCSSPAADPPEPGPPDAGPPDADPNACAAGELTRHDGTCQPAGLPPDMPCPPGEMVLGDGTCQRAGVPPSSCGEGFMPDGNDGCEPLLQAAPCPVGQMAVPGETACREVAPCGSGAWGDIPVEANTQFVDQAYAGGNSDGSQAGPWTSIQAAIDAAEDGAIVAVAAGTYAEDVLIQGKRARLWGRCPGMVEVSGTGAELATIQIFFDEADGTEVRGVAVTGAEGGVLMSGASGVVFERVWVHDTTNIGLDLEGAYGPTSVALRGSLIEENDFAGVDVSGSEALIEATVVRSNRPNVQGEFGYGIVVQDDPTVREDTDVIVRASVVEQNHDLGVFVEGARALIEATVIRATQVNAGIGGRGVQIQDSSSTNTRANVTVLACVVEQNQDIGVAVLGSDALIEATVVRSTYPNLEGEFGSGIGVRDGLDTNARANVTVRACLVEQNQSAGVLVMRSDMTLEATVVRSTLPNLEQRFGRGINIQDSADPNVPPSVTVRASVVEQNHEVGVFVGGARATIEATVVRSTQLDAQDQSGRGISVQNNPDTSARADVTVRACLVEQNRSAGVFVGGAQATIEATVMRATGFDAEGGVGRGINIQDDPMTNARANVILRACLVEQSHDTGVFIEDSDVVIDAAAVRDTAARSDATFGDGILVAPGNVTIQNAEVTRNARAGVASFGGQVTITGGVITCNAFDLDYETHNGVSGSFDGSSGWQCSSRDAPDCSVLGECKAVTSGLEPPAALPPVDPLSP